MNNNSGKITRRRFLAGAAATAGAFTLVPRNVLGGAKFVAPSEMINIAIIGCGGQGRTNGRNLYGQKEARVVAVCDPMEKADYSRSYECNTSAPRMSYFEHVENRYL